MRKMSLLERWGVVTLLIVGAVYGYLQFFRDPLIAEYGKLVKQNNTLVKTVQEAEAPRDTDHIKLSISKIQKEMDGLKKELEKVQTLHLTDKASEEEMVMRINEMAANNGLSVDTLAPYKADNKPLFPGVQQEQKLLLRSLYQVQFSGNFISVYEFLRELGSLPSMVNVTHLNIKRSQESRDVNVELLFVI